MSGVAEERGGLPAPAQEALGAYREQFAGDEAPGGEEQVIAAWAPGRINLIGEHTDYNEGWVLPAAVNRVAALVGRPASGGAVTLYSLLHRELAQFSLEATPEQTAALPLWARYVQATLAQLRAAAPQVAAGLAAVGGFTATIAGDVPLGGGLSSSAALEVATATFAQALARTVAQQDTDLEPLTVARLCQRAEQEGVGVRVGIMDQAASCLGRADHAILLDCRSLDFSYVPARLPEMAWVVFDTRVPHTLAGSEYNVRRAQCERALAILAPLLAAQTPGRDLRALRDVTPDDLASYGDALPDTPEEPLRRRARHVVSENARTLAAAGALRAGDVAALGALLNASHASLRDDYAVSCRELDIAAEVAQATPGVAGARMMGAGFGGCALALARVDALPLLQERLVAEYARRAGKPGAFLALGIGDGPQSRLLSLDS